MMREPRQSDTDMAAGTLAPAREWHSPTEQTRHPGLAPLTRPPGRGAALRLLLRDLVHDAPGTLLHSARREFETAWLAPFVAIAFASGILGYFALPREPQAGAVAALALVAVAVALRARRRGEAARIATLAAAATLGFLAATLETRLVATPRLDVERTVELTGSVETLEPTERGGWRLGLRVDTMTGHDLTPAAVPARISVSVAARGFRTEIGRVLRLKARLRPPSGPLMPGGYDFARAAFFQGRGASGYALGTPRDVTPADAAAPPFAARVERLRRAIAAEVVATLGPTDGAIAAALMVGDTGPLPVGPSASLRASGLYHVMSISGLHMAMVAALLLAGLRGLMALSPAIALGWPTKRIAAALALVATAGYLVLSGAAVATQRSWVMIAIVLVGIIAERPALSRQGVALAALAVLAVSPHAVLDPGFQMSFLAVIALVALWELTPALAADVPLPTARAARSGRLRRIGDWLRRHVAASLLTSAVAGLATAPIIADVFHRGAPYSMLSNMLALPVIGLLVMPMVIAALVAMPFGLDPPFLAVMQLGITTMLAISDAVVALPGADALVGRIHPLAAPLSVAAILAISVLRERWRWYGLLPLAVALALAPFGPRPDIRLSATGKLVAVRAADNRLAIHGAVTDRFATAIWLTADADRRDATDPALARGWTCDAWGCGHPLPRPAAPHSTPATAAPADPAPVLPAPSAGRASPDTPRPEASMTKTATPGGTTPKPGASKSASRESEAPEPGTTTVPLPEFPAPNARTKPVSPAGNLARPDATEPAPAPVHDLTREPATASRAPAEPTSAGASNPPATIDPPASPAPLPIAPPAPGRIVVVTHPAAFDEDCRLARIIVTALEAPAGCADAGAEVFDRKRLARLGAVDLAVSASGAVTIAATALPTHDRPWTPPRPPAPTAEPPRPQPLSAPAVDPTAEPDPAPEATFPDRSPHAVSAEPAAETGAEPGLD